MKNRMVFFTHTAALYALFILGNAVIVLPQKDADVFTFLGYLTATAAAFALLFAVMPISQKLFCCDLTQSKSAFKKITVCTVAFIVAIFALWCAADTFKSFVFFAAEIMLGKESDFYAVLIFFSVVLYFSFKRQENILKFALICFWLILAIIVFFFIACITRYNLRNIFIFSLPDFSALFKQSKPYLINPVITTVILPFYSTLMFKEKRSGAVFSGLGGGFILLGLCILNSVLLFGSSLAGELNYPYASAVSTVTIGRLFTRLDEFSYFLYFITCLLKINVCVFVMFSCLKKINNVRRKSANEKKT